MTAQMSNRIGCGVYNIPGSRLVSNIDLINEIISVVEERHPEYRREDTNGNRECYIDFVEDRLGHDFMYHLDSKENLNAVKNQRKFELEETVDYYVELYKKL